MQDQWNLTEELYKAFQKWPQIVFFGLAGCLIGWAFAFLWPSHYRAEANIYVGLNPYRAYSDANFVALAKPKYSNLDDYKNWQMAQLQSIVFLDEVLGPTLDQLRQEDAYWQSVDTGQLKAMLATEWRTAGKWTLVAEGPKPKRLEQAVQAWSKVIVNQVKSAVELSRQTFMTDEKIQSLTGQQTQLSARQQDLTTTRQSLAEWSSRLSTLPADQPLPTLERWQILYLVTHLADFTPAWQVVMDEQPGRDALPAAYQEWIQQAVVYLDQENLLIDQNKRQLQVEHDQLAAQYSQQSEGSLGFSPNLEIENIDHAPARTIRPTGLLIFIGGFFGLLIWLLVQIYGLTNREKTR